MKSVMILAVSLLTALPSGHLMANEDDVETELKRRVQAYLGHQKPDIKQGEMSPEIEADFKRIHEERMKSMSATKRGKLMYGQIKSLRISAEQINAQSVIGELKGMESQYEADYKKNREEYEKVKKGRAEENK